MSALASSVVLPDDEAGPKFEVYWPRAARRKRKVSLAPRLDTLNGKRIAQLWDYLFRGDEVFAVLEEGMKARYPGVEFVSWSEFGNMHGDNERQLVADLPAKLKALKVDGVISAMAA